MIRDDDRKFIFVHVRKTGGSSITAALGPVLGYEVPPIDDVGWQARVHNYSGMHDGFLWDRRFSDYFSFGFVRNPFDVLVSYYHNWLSAPDGRRAHWRRTKQIGSFPAFVRAFFSEPGYRQWVVEGQEWSLVCKRSGRTVDFLGRFEHLQRDWDRICRHVGLKRIMLPRRNRSYHAPYHRLYDRESRELVETLWASELAFTRYGWDGPVGGSARLPGGGAARDRARAESPV